MQRDDKTKFLLFVQPTIDQKAQRPINDEFAILLRAAVADAKMGTSNVHEPMQTEVIFKEGKTYWQILGIPGVHTCCDGVQSANYDLLLPGGYLTNTLCVHYMMFFRDCITKNDWDKIRDLQRIYGRSQSPLNPRIS